MARGEQGADAAEDHHPDLVVLLGPVEGLVELDQQAPVLGVAGLGTVEQDAHDRAPVELLVGDVLRRRACSTASLLFRSYDAGSRRDHPGEHPAARPRYTSRLNRSPAGPAALTGPVTGPRRRPHPPSAPPARPPVRPG